MLSGSIEVIQDVQVRKEKSLHKQALTFSESRLGINVLGEGRALAQTLCMHLEG
jgi:hypothetical protein